MQTKHDKNQALFPGFIVNAVADDLKRCCPTSTRLEALKFLATERTDPKRAAAAAIPSLFSKSQRLVQQALRTIRSLGVCPDNTERALSHLYDMIESGEIPCLKNPTQLKHAAAYYRSQIAITLAAVNGRSEQSCAIYADIILRDQQREDGYRKAATICCGINGNDKRSIGLRR